MVLEATALDAFLDAPTGRYAVVGTFAFWCLDSGLAGVTTWGRMTEAMTQGLADTFARVLDSQLGQRWPKRLSLFDASAVEGIDSHAFDLMDVYFRAHAARYADCLVKQAMVRPGGIAGSVLAGFFEVVPAEFPRAVFSSLPEALAWLGHEEPSTVVAIEAMRREVSASPPEVMQLREALAGQFDGATLATVARRLAMSPRTLQRRLREAGTSFQTELNAAQVRAASALLADTDLKLTVIALEVGCSSLQHFSRLFRSVTGESPSAYRRRMREGDRGDSPGPTG